MTMIELLLALALLAGLTLACVSWTSMSSRVLASEGGRASWRAAAERSLDAFDRALTIEDRALDGRARERWRVRIDGGSITAKTRSVILGLGGEVAVSGAVRLRVVNGVLNAEYLDEHGRTALSRALVGEVGSLDLVVQEQEGRTARVTVRLVHLAGETVERSWHVREGGLG